MKNVTNRRPQMAFLGSGWKIFVFVFSLYFSPTIFLPMENCFQQGASDDLVDVFFSVKSPLLISMDILKNVLISISRTKNELMQIWTISGPNAPFHLFSHHILCPTGPTPSSGLALLPPKLQRRGLVFKGKMVTVERVWRVTTIVREGLLICVYEWVTLVYGSY